MTIHPFMQASALSVEEEKARLESKYEKLIEQFEKETAQYDRLSRVAVIATFGGVIISILLPLLYLAATAQDPYRAFVSGPLLYLVIAGILASKIVPKLVIWYSNHKKHEVSRLKYKPVTGVCMCDLYQYRTHLHKMDKAETVGERMRHAKLAGYYKHRMGWE